MRRIGGSICEAGEVIRVLRHLADAIEHALGTWHRELPADHPGQAVGGHREAQQVTEVDAQAGVQGHVLAPAPRDR